MRSEDKKEVAVLLLLAGDVKRTGHGCHSTWNWSRIPVDEAVTRIISGGRVRVWRRNSCETGLGKSEISNGGVCTYHSARPQVFNIRNRNRIFLSMPFNASFSCDIHVAGTIPFTPLSRI